jgi:hypothetical protein
MERVAQMSKVQSRPGTAAPLPREWLDTVAPAIRVLFGLIFIAWSWVSTVIIVGTWLRPLLSGATIPGAPDWFLVAFAIALAVSLVEFVASGRWPAVYWIVMLLLDASFTTWQTRAWLLIIMQAQTQIAPLGHAAIWLVSGIGGFLAAKFGEVLLFGKR